VDLLMAVTLTTWSKGILAAFISSASGTIAAVVIDPEHFNLTHAKHLSMIATISGVIGVASYLKKSPLPEEIDMSKWSTFLKIAAKVGPIALQFTPLAPIAGAVTVAIGEAEQIEGASSADKLAHVTAVAVDAANAANIQAGRIVLDPVAVQQEAASAISTTVGAINLIHAAQPVKP
jgi:hypothetical protein